jgi:hypothetical protein
LGNTSELVGVVQTWGYAQGDQIGQIFTQLDIILLWAVFLNIKILGHSFSEV